MTGTAHVDLKWQSPSQLGNEATQDRRQHRKEIIDYYEATLWVEEEGTSAEEQAEKNESMSRRCVWTPEKWKEDEGGSVTARLVGLRPDTRYVLTGLCAVNSIGQSERTEPLIFWTVPRKPVIASIRSRLEEVQVALLATGGLQVQEYAVSVLKQGAPEKQTKVFKLPRSNLTESEDGAYQELRLKFALMPAAEPHENHILHVRASNAGGWSEWSPPLETRVIARQQGAEQAQARLETAMKSKRIEQLAAVLDDVRDIEFPDKSCMEAATSLLRDLKEAKVELTESMNSRDPERLKAALERARVVELPDLGRAENLEKKLGSMLSKLQKARGINALRDALQAAQEIRLPASLLKWAIERLETRERTQQELAEAMVAARCPGLVAVLDWAAGMHLPSEKPAKSLLEVLQHNDNNDNNNNNNDNSIC